MRGRDATPQSAAAGGAGGGDLRAHVAARPEALQGELDKPVACDCLLCGEVMIRSGLNAALDVFGGDGELSPCTQAQTGGREGAAGGRGGRERALRAVCARPPKCAA
jgi:hypothetical protein